MVAESGREFPKSVQRFHRLKDMFKYPVARLVNEVLGFQQLWATIDGAKKVGPVPWSSLKHIRELAENLRVDCEALELMRRLNGLIFIQTFGLNRQI